MLEFCASSTNDDGVRLDCDIQCLRFRFLSDSILVDSQGVKGLTVTSEVDKLVNVQAHIKADYNGERPYFCEEFGKAFCSKDALNEHQVAHS
ncbi:hypothetical protein pipiens_018997 [Culex pipiens pipiens]|uniref:C2H2-type domain-containing protein n=1 Tax=Culex pipiens pipiens TaxID=38569 RepID=A0ABD1DX77_CULPP